MLMSKLKRKNWIEKSKIHNSNFRLYKLYKFYVAGQNNKILYNFQCFLRLMQIYRQIL